MTQISERKALYDAIVSLRDRGYKVLVPQGSNAFAEILPPEMKVLMRDLQPDLVAIRGNEIVVGEVASRGDPKVQSLLALASAVERMPGNVRIELYWTGDEAILPPAVGWVIELAERTMRVAGEDEIAGLLIGWSALEGGIALFAEANGVISEQRGSAQVAEVYSAGLITLAFHNYLRSTGRVRNALAHGVQTQSPPDAETAIHLGNIAAKMARGEYPTVQHVIEEMSSRLDRNDIEMLSDPDRVHSKQAAVAVAKLGIAGLTLDDIAEIAAQVLALVHEDFYIHDDETPRADG